MIDELLQGNEKFLADEFRPHADYYHAIADWLCIATGAKETADRIARERNLSREEKLAVLTEENVKLQIKHLRNLALIRNMHAQGSDRGSTAGSTGSRPERSTCWWTAVLPARRESGAYGVCRAYSVTTWPPIRCSRMMRSRATSSHLPYQVPSGYTTAIGPAVHTPKQWHRVAITWPRRGTPSSRSRRLRYRQLASIRFLLAQPASAVSTHRKMCRSTVGMPSRSARCRAFASRRSYFVSPRGSTPQV